MGRKIAVILEYDGTAYCGWQAQQNGPTVQVAVERAIRALTGEAVSVCGCSRTDAGVHARGFVLNFTTESTIPAENFSLALNAFLPDDISAQCSYEVLPDYHARFDAKRKTYRYLFYPADRPSAILSKRAWHIRSTAFEDAPESFWEEARERMNRAAEAFVGTHDFSAFRAVGSSVSTTVRTIYEAKVSLLPADVVSGRRMFCFEVTGNGFLYNMVRIMAGTLRDVMIGKTDPGAIAGILSSKIRKNAGMTAPPHGLYLEHVEY